MPSTPSTDVIRDAVALACRAPSLHNTQPWRWVFDGVALHLFSDPARMLAGTDAFGREMVISCGVVLDHLVVAMAGQRWRTEVHRYPDPQRRELLASLRFSPVMLLTNAEHDRAVAISRRHTSRAPFGAVADWAHYESVLRSVADDYDVDLSVLPAAAHPELLRAAEVYASLRGQDAQYLAELRWWSSHPDVVEQQVAADPGASRPGWAGRVAPQRDSGWDEADLSDDRATVLVLSTPGDGPLDCLRCGEALSAVLLECTVAGLATCPLTHLTELPASRDILAALIGRVAAPQVLVRLGIPPQERNLTAHTARRHVADVLEVVS
ncbi:NAD(P)H nitroreductase [Aldersonia sp. NBC_00410]|uniref:Acg family FMN-binding oxidoreductase n=1 Tax=Aldersonia sp. NBC_00410 TaxID=2975954 RepID=UPI00225B15F2|nr:NAD(P)H nitroreductase [Aldersonia sp. NBC_00410]MCX5045778.1 NAD(P)H nitroreductase [Aldersonia sp. NBC_00410]